jgi:hypothetical protein
MNQIKLLNKILLEQGLETAFDKLGHLLQNLHIARINSKTGNDADGNNIQEMLRAILMWRAEHKVGG